MKRRIVRRALPLCCLTLVGGFARADINAPPQSLGGHGQPSQTKSLPAPGMATGPAASGGTPAAPPARGSANGATTVAGNRVAAIAKLLSSPDGTVVAVNGKSVSAGQLRDRIRRIAAQLAKPGRQTAVKPLPPQSHPSQTTLAAQNRSLLAELQQSLAAGSGAARGFQRNTALASGPAEPSDVTQLRASAAADLNKPCPLRPPYVEKPKGSLTPGGMIVLGGSCLGASQGELRMYGEFPNGMVQLQIQMWADGGVAAVVPADLTGVLDQKATLRIVRSDGQSSNPRDFDFIATRQTQTVPAELVRFTTCADFANDCVNQSAYHVSYTGDDYTAGVMGGTDIWVAAVGNGWMLQALNIVDAFGGVTASGFDQGPGNAAQIAFAWGGTQLSSTTSHGFFDLIGETEYTYLASYSFSITAVGPAGVSPDPAVKPPYAGKAGSLEHSVQAGNLSSQPTLPSAQAGGGAPPPRPVANQPTWNTIIGNGPGAAQHPPTGIKGVQIPGQPTAVAPGAPVENSH
jgi:hypothetical protein